DDDAPAHLDAGALAEQPLSLPTQSASRQSPGWWGMAIFLLVDAALYAALVFAYCYLWLVAPTWPPPGHGLPGLALPGLGMALLLGGSAATAWARRCNAAARVDGGRTGLLVGRGLLIAFALTQAAILLEYGLPPQTHAYASLI